MTALMSMSVVTVAVLPWLTLSVRSEIGASAQRQCPGARNGGSAGREIGRGGDIARQNQLARRAQRDGASSHV